MIERENNIVKKEKEVEVSKQFFNQGIAENYKSLSVDYTNLKNENKKLKGKNKELEEKSDYWFEGMYKACEQIKNICQAVFHFFILKEKKIKLTIEEEAFAYAITNIGYKTLHEMNFSEYVDEVQIHSAYSEEIENEIKNETNKLLPKQQNTRGRSR